MKKMMITVAIVAVGAVAACADALDDFVRSPQFLMSMQPPASKENPVEYFNKCWKATEAEEWRDAAGYMKRCVELEKNAGILRTDCNLTGYYVWLAMLQWNNNEQSSARDSMREAIRLMKYGESLGQGCEKLAEKFLAKMQSGDLPSRFTPTDILSDCGIKKNIMVPVEARFWKCTNASIARSNLVISWAESMTRTYQMDGERQARMARQGARQEYLRKTGKEFSPDRDTRPSYGKARDEWDACKRVYDIFEN